jgi:type IV pilus assembly protein PilA
MLQRFRRMREVDEHGFTLIELLVVILIIAILAAIAIPVFLRQREKGYRAQLESALKNAATAEESWLASPSNPNNPPTYTVNEADLVGEGLKKAAGVNALNITVDGGKKYCISGTHTDLAGVTMAVSSDDSRPTVGGCAAGGVKS